MIIIVDGEADVIFSPGNTFIVTFQFINTDSLLVY